MMSDIAILDSRWSAPSVNRALTASPSLTSPASGLDGFGSMPEVSIGARSTRNRGGQSATWKDWRGPPFALGGLREPLLVTPRGAENKP
jgi:hypothetical protein